MLLSQPRLRHNDNVFTSESISMRKFIVATAAVISVSLSLTGCMAVPAVLGANMIHKSGTAVVMLEGKSDAYKHFRSAAIQSGGVVTANSPEYSKAEFGTTAVKVELQLVQPGEYQLVGSSNTMAARSWELSDNIGETTQKIADHLAANGFKITNNNRNRGI
jgi:hypothetical protein